MFKLNVVLEFVPYVVRIGSPWLRRKILQVWPSKTIKQAVDIVDVMHDQSVEVYNAKKNALAEGDDAVVQQVGKGKDILSILREWKSDKGIPKIDTDFCDSQG